MPHDLSTPCPGHQPTCVHSHVRTHMEPSPNRHTLAKSMRTSENAHRAHARAVACTCRATGARKNEFRIKAANRALDVIKSLDKPLRTLQASTVQCCYGPRPLGWADHLPRLEYHGSAGRGAGLEGRGRDREAHTVAPLHAGRGCTAEDQGVW